MTQYKLVNENNGKELLSYMSDSMLYYEILISKSEFCDSDMETLNFDIETIGAKDPTSKDNSLNDFLNDEYLSFKEALFCLVGFTPHAVSIYGDDTMSYTDRPGFLVDMVLSETREYRKLKKAPKLETKGGFISVTEDRVYTNGLIPWAIKAGIIEEVFESSNTSKTTTKKLISGEYGRDPETRIPIHRFEIYKETLPGYLESLNSPVSMRALTMPDDGKDGEYTLLIKSRLGVGGPTTKNEIPDLIKKSSWWKSLPKSTRDKIKKQ